MKFLLGTKQYMTQVYTDEGKAVPVTVIAAAPAAVTQVRDKDKDGYVAVQVGHGDQKEERLPGAQKGHLKKAGVAAKQLFREFRARSKAEEEAFSEQNTGNSVDVSAFSEGDAVHVSARSKGKGFQGAVKRHNFAGGRRTHGQRHSEREPGSIGATGPQRVFKGTRMPGRMGGNRVTVRNLKIVQVDTDENQIAVSGAIPGACGSLVEIRSANRE